MNDQQLQAAIESCEKEPIHIPGLTQPHGILLTLRSSDLTILQISECVFDLIGIHHSELLHQPLSKLMDIAPVERATRRLGDRVPRLLNPIPIEIQAHGQAKRFDGILHRSGRVLILELESHISDERGYGGFGGFYEAIREVTSKMMVTENLSEVLELACQELKKLTNFSRVLAYKFDNEWNGEVVNEAKDDEVVSLMHHRFPASDIPKQARDLYTTNWLRLIPNVDYKPSRLVPAINPITDKPLDMSNAVLRSVSPVHLEYMRNMGQAASMSVSLLKGKHLWGLISCHNPEPLYLKYDVRVAAEFIGQMVSAQINAREDAAEIDHKLQLKKLYDDLLRYGGGYQSIPYSFSVNTSSLLGLVDAHGAALCFDGKFICVGATPPAEELRALYEWLVSKNENLFASHRMTRIPGRTGGLSTVATGVLAITLPRGTGDAIIWFRPELRSQTKWAGDPTLKTVSEHGKIHPRNSFETWYENTEGQSKKWRQIELDAADELRSSLLVMAIGYQPSLEDVTASDAFRNSLTNSIATTQATQELRHLQSNAFTSTAVSTEAALDSRLLLEGFSEFAVLFLDNIGRIQNWSAGAKRLLGYESSDVLNGTLQLFFSEEDGLTEKHERVLDFVRKNNRCEEELWLYRADHTSFWGKIMVAQVRSKTGSLIGFSIVIQDVTKEKSAEEELKAMKLTAEAANRAKSAFLANISHEIRTPLGAVLGFSELMSARNLDDDAKLDLFDKVRRNGEQLTILINDLLDLSKVESGKIEVERLEVDLPSLLADCEQIFKLKAGERGVSLRFEVTGKVPRVVMTDPTRLRQVVINLLNNAIKFTASGGSVVVNCSYSQNPQGARVAIRVIDTGRGMTETEMGRLFQPFAQADVSTTREYGGTGLGLFLSQRLARALGGDLSIEHSERGKGSCFIFYFDPGDTDLNLNFEDNRDLFREQISEVESESSLDGLHVLVVDDSVDNRELIKSYLTKAGAEVSLAENGQIGVEAALSGEFDVVLMDVQMPVLDGNRAMRILIESDYKKPVIALTAHAMREERDYSLSIGFRDYITKPIDRKGLIKRILQFAE